MTNIGPNEFVDVFVIAETVNVFDVASTDVDSRRMKLLVIGGMSYVDGVPMTNGEYRICLTVGGMATVATAVNAALLEIITAASQSG